MRKTLKLSSDGDDCGSKKWGLAEFVFEGRMESGGRFCVDAFSLAVKLTSRLLYYIKKVYKRSFSAI
jgi:hypothetical protein